MLYQPLHQHSCSEKKPNIKASDPTGVAAWSNSGEAFVPMEDRDWHLALGTSHLVLGSSMPFLKSWRTACPSNPSFARSRLRGTMLRFGSRRPRPQGNSKALGQQQDFRATALESSVRLKNCALGCGVFGGRKQPCRRPPQGRSSHKISCNGSQLGPHRPEARACAVAWTSRSQMLKPEPQSAVGQPLQCLFLKKKSLGSITIGRKQLLK